ncbi:hypothetical protein [Saccharothrix stipae]
MSMPEWLQWTTLVAGAGGPLGTAALLVKARADAKKTGADTTGVLVGASGDVIRQYQEMLAGLTEDVKELKRKDRERDAAEEQHEMLLRRHSRWDRTVAEQVRDLGGVVSDPPPLWPAVG